MVASITALPARQNPKKSFFRPLCSTWHRSSARSSVPSAETSAISSQEHAPSNTAPGITRAGKWPGTSLYNPHRTYARALSVRLATPYPLLSKFLHVRVFRNGRKMTKSSPHTRPIGAKFGLPASSRVEKIVSTIIGYAVAGSGSILPRDCARN